MQGKFLTYKVLLMKEKNNMLTPNKAMLLAAGFGTRMRPLTNKIPKPLVEVSGRSLLDRAIDRVAEIGINECVINIHHLGDKIRNHMNGRNDLNIAFSEEDTLLETGGGVKKALPLLGDAPFFAINSDILWFNGPASALQRLADIWDDEKMDVLLLLQPVVNAFGYEGKGDFILDKKGTPRRRLKREVAPYLFAGVQIINPRVFENTPEGSFSLNLIYDKAIESGRLHCMPHDGEWYHVGTVDSIAMVEELIEKRGTASQK